MLKIKKGAVLQQFNLNDVKFIVSKMIKTIPGNKFYLAIEDNQGRLTSIFKEDIYYWGNRWKSFAERLSGITNLALRQEYYMEQMDGSLLLTPITERAAARRHGLIILSVHLIISIIGAEIYKIYETSRVFILCGLITVAINISLSFIYAFLSRQKLGYLGNSSNLILIICIFTLIIPYALFYLFSIQVLSGFRWPFMN